MELTIQDVASMAAVGAFVYTIFQSLVQVLFGYLTAKFGNNAKSGVVEQSEKCHFDHMQIHSQLQIQQKLEANQSERTQANITRMLDQNEKLIGVISDVAHASDLRHQEIISSLAAIKDNLKST